MAGVAVEAPSAAVEEAVAVVARTDRRWYGTCRSRERNLLACWPVSRVADFKL